MAPAEPRYAFLILAVVLLAQTQASTQFNPRDHRIQTYSVEDGLSQSSIWCMMQDSQGFMWFGTADGLNRFDGYTFKVYRHDARDSTSLRSNTVWSILEDQRGTIWVGTLRGLHRFDRRREKFTYIADDSLYRSAHLTTIIYSLLEDGDGNIWVASTEGIAVLNASTGMLREFRASDLGLEGEGNRLHFVDEHGDVWLSLSGHLMKYRSATKSFVEIPDVVQKPGWVTLHRDASGMVWMGSPSSAEGLQAFREGGDLRRRRLHAPGDPQSLSSDFVRALCTDAEGRVWVGTAAAGLNVFEPERNRFTRIVPQSSTNTFYDKVSAIYRDRSGLLWIGYDGAGIVKINPRRNKFRHVLLPPSRRKDTGDNFFKALMVDHNDRVWLGMYNQGVAVLDRRTGRVQRFEREFAGDTESNSVFSILEDRRGAVWIGTLRGLYGFDPQSNRVRKHDIGGGNPRGRIITALCEDSSGALWIGSATSVLRYNHDRDGIEEVLNLADADTSSAVSGVLTLAADRDGLWCGTLEMGLLRLTSEGRLLKQYKSNPLDLNSLAHNSVKTICFAPDGILWLGTEDGLSRFDPARETWRTYRSADGLPNDFIYGVLMDRSGNLWISTNRGLSKMSTADPERPRFRNYTVNDGLQSAEFNTNTYFQTPGGEMFFGGVNGFNCFFPDSVRDNPAMPPVVFTRFKKFDQPVTLDGDIAETQEIRLHYSESVFSFEFAALEFTDPQENRYAYMMEGFDKDWVYCGRRREARYTNLDPGEYRFRIRACNSDGVWNVRDASVRVVVVPPFWRTGWFIGLMVLLGVGTFGGTVRFISTQKLKKRISQLEREKEIQDERLRTRERIARDLHDDLASTVGSAGFFIESVKGQLKDIPAQSKEFLDRTSSLLTEAEEAMSDIVWSVSPKHDTLESLLARMRLTTADLCRANNIKYDVDVSGDVEGHAVTEQVRRNLFLIFKEALSNAVRHSGASSISVSFSIRKDEFEMCVGDNGRGIFVPEPSATTKRGHGLRNMSKRAEEIQAQLSLEPGSPSGTIVRVVGRMTQTGH